MNNGTHRRHRHALGIVLGLAAPLLSQTSPLGPDLGGDWNRNAAEILARGPQHFDEKSILVKFHPGIGKEARHAVARLLGGQFQDQDGDGVDDRYSHIADGCWAEIDLGRSSLAYRASSALTRLQDHPDLAYVQLNTLVSLEKVPNDPSYSQLWGMTKIQAPEAWNTTTGSSDVVVGVIDTGLLYTHPDLKANLWVNPREIAGNGKDDDGNGYVDDVHGINAITGTGDPLDTKNGHGTHCAGTIGAVGNNGVGVVGVTWNVKLVGMKFLNDKGSGSDADAAKCVNYAIGLKKRGVNLRILSNSWGGGAYNQALLDAIKAAEREGMLFVAAAGNDRKNNDTTAHYPNNYPVENILSVASTTSADGLSDFSNYGPKMVDMGAPGSSILSTHLGNGYKTLSGTSMATPHVAGAAALLLALDPNLDPARLKSLLMGSGDAISALAGKTVSGKRLNIRKALEGIQNSAPKILVEPEDQTGKPGGTATFSVQASGAPTPTYQWFRNGVSIPGGTASTYTTPALAPADDGSLYRVEVSNSAGRVVSREARLSVAETPGDGNLALRKPATASGQYQDFEPARAFDGQATSPSYWSVASGTALQWLRVDLLSPASISRAKIQWSTRNHARNYALQYLQGDAWTTVWSTTSGSGGLQEAIFPAVVAREWRLTMTQPNSSYYTVYECQLFER